MPVYIAFFILLLLVTNIYFLLNSKNEFHLKYLFKHILVNFLIFGLLAFGKNYSNGLDYTVFLIFNLQLLSSVYLYYHIYSLIAGQKKKISNYNYIFFIVLLVIFILNKFDIQILQFNENLKTPNFYDLEVEHKSLEDFTKNFIPIKHLFQIGYLMLIYFLVNTSLAESKSIKNKTGFKIWIYTYLSLSLLSIFTILFIIYNPFYLSDQVLNILIQSNGAVSIILVLSYFTNPILFISILKTKLNNNNQADTTTTFMQINDLIVSKEMFLDSNLAIGMVSSLLSLKDSEVREAIGNHTNDNFNMYLNTLRINYSIDFLNKDYLNKHTIESLSSKCGFNSPQSFYRTFKKLKKTTPKEYYNNL